MGDMTVDRWLATLRSPKSNELNMSEWPYRYQRDMGKAKAGDIYGVPEQELVQSGLLDFLENIKRTKGKNHKVQAGEIEDFLQTNDMKVTAYNLADVKDADKLQEASLPISGTICCVNSS